MSEVEMVMPQMGESIAEATIAKWLKQPGDAVEKDEIILEISTDKVDSEIPAPAAGVLKEVLFNEGDVVPVKEKIATIDTEGKAGAKKNGGAKEEPKEEKKAKEEQSEPEESQEDKKEKKEAAPSESPEPSSNGSSSGQPQRLAKSGGGRFYSPVVRTLAAKHGISEVELEEIEGSGQGGRVTKQDFLSYLESRDEGTSSKPAGEPAQQKAEAPARVASPPAEYKPPQSDMPSETWSAEGTKVVPMDNMRQIIAEHMVRSKQTSPHVYSVQEVDCSKISAWRARNKGGFKAREGFNLSYTPFFLEAAIQALLEFPIVNSSVDGKSIVMKRNINLGCAVALGNSGLIVPVIKRAEERNFVGIARALNDLALRARSKKLMPDEVTGGTFTVTNPGIFGTMIGTPIINQPQVAILCLGAIKKRPVVVDDMIAVREVCYLTLSYDHRIIDGAVGGQFLKYLREYLEGWDMERPLG